MSDFKRMMALSGLTGMLAGLVFAASAQANGFKGDCAINGVMKTNPPVQLLFASSGTFTFTGTFTCNGVEKESTPVVVSVPVSSTGTWVSMVCGTGTADSAVGQTTVTSSPIVTAPLGSKINYVTLFASMGYHVDFVGFQGLFKFTDSGKNAKGLPEDGKFDLSPPPPTNKGLPPNPPPGGDDCEKAFTVTGLAHKGV